MLNTETGGGRASAAGDAIPELLRGETYPIGLWWPPPPHETTRARYAEIIDAGFTFVNAGNGVTSPETTVTMLNVAAEYGLPALVVDDRITGVHAYPRDQWQDVVKQAYGDYRRFPSFAGFNIRDEPSAGELAQIGAVIELLRRLDSTKLGYVNLYPTYVSAERLGTPTYQGHLDRYLAEARPDFVSFDHYPLLDVHPNIRGDYFANWAMVRATAERAGLPYWGFVLSCDHFDYRPPTEDELRWQVNVSLAYGARGIQYFTYWTPRKDGYREGLVTCDGQLSPMYFAVARINNDYLRPLGAQLLNLASESVMHIGEPKLPAGAAAFRGDGWIAAAAGDAAIIGRLRGSDPSVRWALVTNRNVDAAATTTLAFGANVDAVDEFDPASAAYQLVRPEPLSEGAVLTVRLAPGAARLYRLRAVSISDG